FESCNLGSINLSRMVREESGRPRIDWGKLRSVTRKAVRFLDDVIVVNRYPIPELERMARANRKIGLGVMGFSDMLIRLGISYDSDRAVGVAEAVMKAVSDEAFKASQALAGERGVFENWKGSVYESRGVEVRNATRTAIAPTGTIGILAGTSPSIEPLFALAYRRSHVLDGKTLYEVNPLLREYAGRLGMDVEDLVEKVRKTGSLSDVPAVPDSMKAVFVTALEIPFERHLQMQAAFQRQADNSVSKTVNLPQDASCEDVGRVYRRAWVLGLKGITVYRYGSRSSQVLELGAGERGYHYDHAARCDPEECKV
ncbi:MAG: ribonucleotide-diphosphate reductase subunit alpha, partial [Desulfobacteraceae bacterium]